MGKKIWQPIDGKNFGYDITVRMVVVERRPSGQLHLNQCEMSHCGRHDDASWHKFTSFRGLVFVH